MRPTLAALIVIGFAVNDCSAGDKAKSPEAVFGAFTAAAKKEDMKALLSQLTKDSQSFLAAGMIRDDGHVQGLGRDGSGEKDQAD